MAHHALQADRHEPAPSLRRARLLALLVVGSLVLAAPAAAAPDTQVLMQQLRKDPDFKVRLSAAMTLGRRGDRAALPALVDALADSEGTVRAVAAGAVGNMVDRRADAALRRTARQMLERLAAKDPEGSVKTAAAEALEAVQFADRAAQPRKVQNSVYVHVQGITDPSGQMQGSVLDAMADVAKDVLLATDSSFVVEWPGGAAPSSAVLTKAKTRAAFGVIGTVDEISVKPQGKRVKVACKLRMILTTYPDMAMRAFFNGGAGLDTSAQPEALERAKARCNMDVIKHLVQDQVATDIQARAR